MIFVAISTLPRPICLFHATRSSLECSTTKKTGKLSRASRLAREPLVSSENHSSLPFEKCYLLQIFGPFFPPFSTICPRSTHRWLWNGTVQFTLGGRSGSRCSRDPPRSTGTTRPELLFSLFTNVPRSVTAQTPSMWFVLSTRVVSSSSRTKLRSPGFVQRAPAGKRSAG